jgi:hypothetical protein
MINLVHHITKIIINQALSPPDVVRILISISYGKQMLPPPAAAHPGVANLAVT